MLRSVAAVIAGYLVLAVLTILTTVGLSAANPDTFPPMGSGRTPDVPAMAVIAGLSALFTVLGGYVTAWIARRAEWKHALALGLLCEVFALFELTVARMGRPLGFMRAAALPPIPAALLGGGLRARRSQPAAAPVA